MALERKYAELKKPLEKKRDDIIAGEIDFDEKVFEGRDDDYEAYKEAKEDEKDTKGIPNFWFQALSNFHSTAEYIQPEDFEALEALKDIRCELNETYTGFSIIFSFEENEYFTNQELRKDYVVSPDLLEENYPSLESATGSEIDWKPNKNLCEKTIQKRQKAKSGKRKGETRVISTTEEVPSFFHFFRDPREPEDEDDEDDDEENRNPHLGSSFLDDILGCLLLSYCSEAFCSHFYRSNSRHLFFIYF